MSRRSRYYPALPIPLRGDRRDGRCGTGLEARLHLTSPSLAGICAAVAGGLGITVRTTVSLPKTLSVLDPETTGLLPLPYLPLNLHQAEEEPASAVGRLAEILFETRVKLPGTRGTRDALRASAGRGRLARASLIPA